MERTRARRNLASFFSGFTSAFDLSGQSLIEVPDLSTGPARDREALRGDWSRVGMDIRGAVNQVQYLGAAHE